MSFSDLACLTTSMCTFVTSGHVASKYWRFLDFVVSSTWSETPWALKITRELSGISSISSTKTAVFVEEIDEIPDNSLVIFSAHGVSDQVEETTKSRNLQYFDATCPLVTKVHMEVVRHARSEKDIILIGHEGLRDQLK